MICHIVCIIILPEDSATQTKREKERHGGKWKEVSQHRASGEHEKEIFMS